MHAVYITQEKPQQKSNSKQWLRSSAYIASLKEPLIWTEMTGQRKVVLDFQEWQTGKVNIWEETDGVRFGVRFICGFLWFHSWANLFVSTERRIYILPLGRKEGAFSAFAAA